MGRPTPQSQTKLSNIAGMERITRFDIKIAAEPVGAQCVTNPGAVNGVFRIVGCRLLRQAGVIAT
jgi:hypothetical protein